MAILTPQQVVRAWKDEEFRSTLTEEQIAALPVAPSNIDELSQEELEQVAGGADWCVGTCKQTCNKESSFTKE